ncbi:antibiotic biosynthesis monooxygenase [Rhizorhabdus wittichii DC-6]|jgi:quinol monooxygenase YgiN|uniref:putative quinol monooxygenase n=1 Tax=Rhizorhabdus wittichii TaxID=160791 RepID=UPI0002DD4780|nr:antibiotic biosynthesis monooxygenase family protein [Rhizorhabdus wittichii]ARR55662.1 antibiotic biosynthesis monooxygenase [Rhizorhabdus wittichii DC-6]
MTTARLYIMHAKEGRDAELETALRDLAAAVAGFTGSEGAEVLRDAGNERRFVLIEKWASIEAHEATKEPFKKLPMMGALMEALDGPPDGSYYDYLVR